MKNVLLINGHEPYDFAKGEFNSTMYAEIEKTLADKVNIEKTIIKEGYSVEEEQAKFKKADLIIFQFPIYWFSMPAMMKKYLDTVYGYGVFFGMGDAEAKYGYGNGMMQGKKYMLSITSNAPQEAFNNKDQFFEGLSIEQFLMNIHKVNEFCGMEALPSFAAYNVIKNPQIELDIQRIQEHLKNEVLTLVN